jgi:hypothetical protein
VPYKGPPVICRFCGLSFRRPASLVRHLDEGRCPRRSAAIVPANAGGARVEILDVTPSRSHGVRSEGESAPESPPQRETRIVLASRKATPGLLLPEKPLNQWEAFDSGGLTGMEAFEREGAIGSQQASDEVTLRSQYHALKALAVRLDAGVGTERERVAFEFGLREYEANYQRIRESRSVGLLKSN